VPAFNNIALPPNAENIAYQSTSTILYTLSTPTGTIGYDFDLFTQVRRELFILPLQQLRTIWGNGLTNSYLYTKPSGLLEGYAYTVQGNGLTPTSLYGNGLSLLANNTAMVHTFVKDNTIVSSGQTDTVVSTTIGIPMIPEKCTFTSLSATTLWCAVPKNRLASTFINDWYKGKVSSNDELWSVDIQTRTASAVLDFELVSGRIIDATDVGVTEGELFVFFRNRSDNTLWMFDPIANLSQ
jgi:hypothetical protein